MKKVFKYALPPTDGFTLDLPRDAKLLSVRAQRGQPQLWALVDPEATPEPRVFRLVCTGHELHGEYDYVGTFHLHDGLIVMHLFVLPLSSTQQT